MAGAGGLAIILVAGAVGIMFLGGVVALIGYGMLTRRHRRGYLASVAALVLVLISIVLCLPISATFLSGHGSHGETLDGGEQAAAAVFVGAQVLAALVSLVSALRHRARRGAPPAPARG